MLVGKAATEDTINGWDSVSGATRTSKASERSCTCCNQVSSNSEETVTS